MRTLIHSASPLDVCGPNDFFEAIVRRYKVLAVITHRDGWLVEIIEQQSASLELTLEHRLQRPDRIGDMRSEPSADFDLRLLHPRNGRCAFHGAGPREPADCFFRTEFASLTDLSFEAGFALRPMFIPFAAHVHLADVGDKPMAIPNFSPFEGVNRSRHPHRFPVICSFDECHPWNVQVGFEHENGIEPARRLRGFSAGVTRPGKRRYWTHQQS
jgi:hypothetical protein